MPANARAQVRVELVVAKRHLREMPSPSTASLATHLGHHEGDAMNSATWFLVPYLAVAADLDAWWRFD